MCNVMYDIARRPPKLAILIETIEYAIIILHEILFRVIEFCPVLALLRTTSLNGTIRWYDHLRSVALTLLASSARKIGNGRRRRRRRVARRESAIEYMRDQVVGFSPSAADTCTRLLNNARTPVSANNQRGNYRRSIEKKLA